MYTSTEDTPFESAPLHHRRECDCPPYVDRCAHWGEWRVWLVTQRAASEELLRRGFTPEATCCPDCGTPVRDGRALRDIDWYIAGGPGVMQRPECRCTVGLLTKYPVTSRRDRSAAEQAFHERVALMLAEEEE